MFERMTQRMLLLLQLVVVISSVSCSSNDDVPVNNDASYAIRFTIGSEVDASRADSYTPGEDMENYIRDMRVYIFVDGKYYEDVNVVNFAQSIADAEKYVVSATIDKLPTKDFKVLVLTNMDTNGGVNNYYPSMNSGTTLQGVVQWNCYFKYHDTSVGRDRCYDAYKPSADLPIPMYGVKTYSLDNLSFDKNLATDFGEVNLLRAYAKVRINSSKELQDVTLTRCKVGGLGCPLGIYVDTSYPTTSNMNVPNSVNYYRNTEDVYDLPFDVLDDNKTFQIYIPEYNNLDNAITRTEITFKYKGIDYKVEFKDYETGEYFNILRNYFYQFDVSFTDYPTINVRYSVSSWKKRSTPNIKFD
jgi:hypothetical protein